MNLHRLLSDRADKLWPVRVGLIGAGKFGAMFLSQTPTTRGLRITAIADLDPERAKTTCRNVGWSEERIAETAFVDPALDLIARRDVDLVVEATGNPIVGIDHALAAFNYEKHIVMVNVEADALAGPALAKRAREAGVIYSLAYGDQPALICEMVDWARSSGFKVVAAGKGTKYLPLYHEVTPDDVWRHYGLSQEQADAGGMNPRLFNSFLDGTKSAIEMAAVANACDLDVPTQGLLFPPCGVDDLPHVLRPVSSGGLLERSGMVEVVSSLERDRRTVFRDLRWGVYCVFEAPNDYSARCFQEYGLKTDSSGRFAATYKPYHLIGMELGVSVLSVALRAEPTGQPLSFRGDVVAVAKRDLAVGERLDGEGGFTVWGRLLPAAESVRRGALPIGFAHGVKLRNSVMKGTVLTRDDVEMSSLGAAQELRRETERLIPVS
jgi:predicted homoserine dehydrogenase-like protein